MTEEQTKLWCATLVAVADRLCVAAILIATKQVRVLNYLDKFPLKR